MAGEGKTFVYYEDFGAKGDGRTDDQAAIVAAHEYANKNGLPVRANDKAVYYIGGGKEPAVIQTDVDFGKARIVIDDRHVENRWASVFEVKASKETYDPQLKGPVREGQKKLDHAFPCKSMVIIHDDKVKHFIRWGVNHNDGTAATDCFLVDEEGNVDPATPIVWDFPEVTRAVAIPLEEKPLVIKGGIFTTIANREESKYSYFYRGISIQRCNVTVSGMCHLVEGEGDHGAPYNAFLYVTQCANVVLRDCQVTGRLTYKTAVAEGGEVTMGSYDLNANRVINLSFLKVRQLNDILDTRYWGVLGTNFCKNLLYDNCYLSRFDAHCGVCNATIRNSELGHQGLSIIGYGTFLLENSTIHGGSDMISLRLDYGSFWRGDIIIRNSVFKCRSQGKACVIGGRNKGDHNFGYRCVMPWKITIDGLLIDDSVVNAHNAQYQGPFLLDNFNPDFKEGYHEDFPYVRTKKIVARRIRTVSGKPVHLAMDPLFFAKTALEMK